MLNKFIDLFNCFSVKNIYFSVNEGNPIQEKMLLTHEGVVPITMSSNN